MSFLLLQYIYRYFAVESSKPKAEAAEEPIVVSMSCSFTLFLISSVGPYLEQQTAKLLLNDLFACVFAKISALYITLCWTAILKLFSASSKKISSWKAKVNYVALFNVEFETVPLMVAR